MSEDKVSYLYISNFSKFTPVICLKISQAIKKFTLLEQLFLLRKFLVVVQTDKSHYVIKQQNKYILIHKQLRFHKQLRNLLYWNSCFFLENF
jgi:hypothetical protein